MAIASKFTFSTTCGLPNAALGLQLDFTDFELL
jgi:hypothetical protein